MIFPSFTTRGQEELQQEAKDVADYYAAAVRQPNKPPLKKVAKPLPDKTKLVACTAQSLELAHDLPLAPLRLANPECEFCKGTGLEGSILNVTLRYRYLKCSCSCTDNTTTLGKWRENLLRAEGIIN